MEYWSQNFVSDKLLFELGVNFVKVDISFSIKTDVRNKNIDTKQVNAFYLFA